MDKIKFAKLITSLRKEKNLTQQDIAERFHVSPQAVSKWENGDSMPDIEILEQMSLFYGISINELLDGEKNSSFKQVKKEKKQHSGVFNILLSSISLTLIGIFTFMTPYLIINENEYGLYDILFANNYKIGNFLLLLGLLSFGASTILSIIYGIKQKTTYAYIRNITAFIASAIFIAPTSYFYMAAKPGFACYLIFFTMFISALLSLFLDPLTKKFYATDVLLKKKQFTFLTNIFFTIASLSCVIITYNTFPVAKAILILLITIILIALIIVNTLYNLISKQKIALINIIGHSIAIVLLLVFILLDIDTLPTLGFAIILGILLLILNVINLCHHKK